MNDRETVNKELERKKEIKKGTEEHKDGRHRNCTVSRSQKHGRTEYAKRKGQEKVEEIAGKEKINAQGRWRKTEDEGKQNDARVSPSRRFLQQNSAQV